MKNNLPILSRPKNWMVVYTQSKWEKKVDQLLHEKGIEAFCPTVKKEQQWADRKKTVDFPLFSSYVFVKVNSKEEQLVRQTRGVVNFIYHEGKPATVGQEIIEDIQTLVKQYPDLETISLRHLKIGNKVMVKNGAFAQQSGQVIKIEGKYVLMVIDHLDCAITTRVNKKNITFVH